MKKYVIELRGVEFHNKGAELMLHAILAEVREKLPTAVFVMEKRENSPIYKQREVGVYTKLNFRRFGINLGKWAWILPKMVRRKLGFVLEKEINVIMDGSGFAFGDFWGAKKAGERLADHVVKWKRGDKKIILLPQAFGTFTDEKLKNKMHVILNNADLIFARDKYSYEYLGELEGKKANIHLKPDFTNLIKGQIPAYFDKKQYEVAIIPNNKLLDSNIFKDRNEYITFLQNVCEYVRIVGRNPFFLIHEGEKDLKIAENVNELLVSKVPILKEDNPLYVKGIIGNSVAVVTSRFHGLVSALAQAIPCICVGWSHKYQALMEDYDYADGLLADKDLHSDALMEKLNMILNAEYSAEIAFKLREASAQQKKRAQDMWSKVFEVIK